MQKATFTLLLLFTFTVSGSIFAQSAPESVNTSTGIIVPGGGRNYVLRSHVSGVNGVMPSQNYTMRYNNSANVKITDFTMGGYNYINFSVFDTVVFRRAANAWVTTAGDKQHIYVEGPNNLDNSTFNFNMPVAYPASSSFSFMHKAIREGYVNRGSDNVFNNDSTSDLTYNNIERIDFVYKLGTASLDVTKAGFLITERGGNDGFKVAAITAVDAAGNPTAFGPVRTVTTASYGSPIMNCFTYVLRKDAADNDIRLFSKVPNQQVRSVFLSFQFLGVAALQKIYGYALMGNDVTATTGAQVVDFTNTTYFPRTTNNANGGMDLASAPGIFHTNMVLAGHFFELKYQTRNCSVNLEWTDQEYRQVKEYVVEKSYDQVQFAAVAVIPATVAAQRFNDETAANAAFYRVKIIPRDGPAYYSQLVYVSNICGGGGVTVFPNPVEKQLQIRLGGDMQVKQVQLQGLSGSQMGLWDVNTTSKLITLDVSALRPGQYILVTTDTHNRKQVQKIIKK